ncbi:ATP-binding protein [Sphingomonas kyeonggiensis]|uniref:histidine kinase n=1 Tax=Sphingomonas kyeonggiensis TaxID=1268553 RepID=A0A7W6JQY8_9SPHN|nr:ATP-binding protein [Sphingomonas kyeonggiensis]MBB4096875.1 two-component system phosphate regulon sensor histidine kinase PhoR [Sphingomonas kyeonggiensis]
MPYSPGIKALVALGIVAAGALAGLLLGGDVQTSLVMLVCGVAAVLLATAGAEAPGTFDTAPTVSEGPGIAEVLDAIAEPVLLIADRRVTAANPPARTLLGQHILGEDVRVAIRHPAAAERLMNTSDQNPGAPIHLVGLGTRDQRWEMRVTAIADGRRIVHLIDRTGSYASERMRVDFVANASHELRTPLASLLGYVETLEDGAGEEPGLRKRFLKIMHDEARRMQRLIDDLISLSRIEAEKYRAPDNPVALDELIDEVCLELSGVPRAADVVTEVAEVPPVRGDASQLSQLLHNVIGNAMKYGKEGTPILVSLLPEGESMIRLTVTDQGDGIAPEHLPRLTERFYRVDAGRSRTIGGTGLGLSIVKHIVERHRGRFDITSTVGKGSTVTVLLPVQRLS